MNAVLSPRVNLSTQGYAVIIFDPNGEYELYRFNAFDVSYAGLLWASLKEDLPGLQVMFERVNFNADERTMRGLAGMARAGFCILQDAVSNPSSPPGRMFLAGYVSHFKDRGMPISEAKTLIALASHAVTPESDAWICLLPDEEDFEGGVR